MVLEYKTHLLSSLWCDGNRDVIDDELPPYLPLPILEAAAIVPTFRPMQPTYELFDSYRTFRNQVALMHLI